MIVRQLRTAVTRVCFSWKSRAGGQRDVDDFDDAHSTVGGDGDAGAGDAGAGAGGGQTVNDRLLSAKL